MDHYLNFTPEDFVWDDAFRKWVLRPSLEDHAKWESWLRQHPDKTAVISRAREIMMAIAPVSEDLPESEKQEAIRRIVKANQRKHRLAAPVSIRGRRYFWAAASIVLLLGISWMLYDAPVPHLTAKTDPVLPIPEPVEKVNTTGVPMVIGLPDGSVIRLDPQSRIAYPAGFGKENRMVSLTGDAFFSIKRDTAHPFLVYAGETVTKVLGTSFRINAHEDAPEIVVTVASGKVSVFTKRDFEDRKTGPDESGVILTINQKAVFLKENAQLSKMLAEVPEKMEIPDRQIPFDFDNTPLPDVFALLTEAYGIEIIYDTAQLEDRTLTVSLEDEPLYEKLDVICKTMRLSYRVAGTKVYIEFPPDRVQP